MNSKTGKRVELDGGPKTAGEALANAGEKLEIGVRAAARSGPGYPPVERRWSP
jgi:hypothetical protein